MSKVICPEPGVQMTQQSESVPFAWSERIPADASLGTQLVAMQAQIDDLAAALSTIENETIERCSKVWTQERGYDKYGVAEFLRKLKKDG